MSATRGKSDPQERFRRVRLDHARELAEDYTELIFELGHGAAPVRQVELARQLGVSHVTVLRTLRRLERNGYVRHRRGAGVTLTDAGRRLALAARRRHETVLAFLLWMGVPGRVAAVDAEGIEHHLSPATLRRMEALMRGRE